MAEMLPAGFEDPAKWWTPENMACEPIGAEMGVDFIKTTVHRDPDSGRTSSARIYNPHRCLRCKKSKDPADLLTGL